MKTSHDVVVLDLSDLDLLDHQLFVLVGQFLCSVLLLLLLSLFLFLLQAS